MKQVEKYRDYNETFENIRTKLKTTLKYKDQSVFFFF